MNGRIHKLIFRMLIPSAAALLATACGKTAEAPDAPAAESGVAVDFNVVVDNGGGEWDTKTRALDPAGIPAGARFGVFAYKTAGTAWPTAAPNATPNVMLNQMVEKTATGAVYSPVRTWSIVPTHKYTFFAYMPYSDGTENGITTDIDATTKNVPRIDFTVQGRVADQVDLLAAQVTDRTPGDHSPVVFTFRHATTRIRFAIAYGAGTEAYSVKVTGIRLGGIRNAGTLALGGTANTTPSWTQTSGDASYTILDKDAPGDDLTLGYSATPTLIATPGCYMIPQDGTAEQPIVVEVDYAVTTHAGSEPYVKTTAASFAGSTGWTIGKSMLYTLTLQPTTVGFTAKVEGWETVNIDSDEIVLTEEPMI